MSELQKQDAGNSGAKETERENFSAEEIAQESAYQDSTEVAQQMRRGGEQSKEKADARDAAGSSEFKDWDQRQIRDKAKP